ncbi:hypothetical protein [Ktedonobacter sp. SOSP1-52]|uniref:hypothetical protein n=1 Tax=Ktedonobacter sp. SOSP1-52 TaxID=2778366 RepID=UPI00191554EF|nr:hypothetical protein [Ktedonobacter sp. SOSP1-52]
MTQISNSSKTAAKGGFQHGLPTVSTLPIQQSGCCGTTSQSASTGCCGEPTTSQAVSTGCCGEPTSNAALSTETQVTGGCCGEPVQGDSPASQQRCC